MRLGVIGVAVVSILLSSIWASDGSASNNLEMVFDRDEVPGSVDLYDILMEANADSGTTCELVTPLGTYSCIDVGDGFRPQQDFIEDHSGLTLAELQAATSVDWTLTWDAGSPTQIVVNIDFGTPVLESDFLLIPTLTFPVDDECIGSLTPTIEWTYGATEPCDLNAQGEWEEIEVIITNEAGTERDSDDLVSCAESSLTHQ